MKSLTTDFENKIRQHIDRIYEGRDNGALCRQIAGLFSGCGNQDAELAHWSEEEIILITYGNSITSADEAPLRTLHRFAGQFFENLFSIVHVLPFFPYTSDDGFAVMDYYEVNPSLGEWQDITALSESFRLMGDLVINHTSSRCEWFENFKKSEHPGKDYYINVDPESDLSRVTRPRTSPLLKEIQTPEGPKFVWCTFSHDQVDLDFKNPEVLVEFLKILHFYLKKGIRVFRLDAVAFLWKEIGTACLHLEPTHEIIKLMRTVTEHCEPAALILTETNVPSAENLSYLGKGDEAHLIYNFPLPPLLLNTLVTGDSTHLVTWLTSVPHLLPGTSCLNFIASHDGIGLRPAEGFMEKEEIAALIDCMKSFGGRVSTRALNDSESNPYEINISLWSALAGTIKKGPDQYQLERFVLAHAVMLCLQGIPAFYIHSVLGTENDISRMETLGSNRAINRHIWEEDELLGHLKDETSHHHQVYKRLKFLIGLRKNQAAFHPQAGQFIKKTSSQCLVVQRLAQSLEPGLDEDILCVYNMTDKPLELNTPGHPLMKKPFKGGLDLISNRRIQPKDTIGLAPYEFMWILNRQEADR